MPVSISVSDVRREIYRAADFAAGDGKPSNGLLGAVFHKAFRHLMSPDGAASWTNVLDFDDLNQPEKLRSEIYNQVVGSELRRSEADLQQSAEEVLTLWEALGHLTTQICRLLTNSYRQKLLQYDSKTNEWRGAQDFSTEETLTWQVEDPQWSAPVLVSGVADAVWRNPASRSWGILELKLGAGAGDADLAQLCLYHEMINAQVKGNLGRLTLWHFAPQLKATQFAGKQVEPVRDKLIALIGRMAGVAPNADGQPELRAYRLLGKQLVTKLQEFGPIVTLESDPVVGPTFLRFHIQPGAGVSVRKILSLGKDLGLQLRLQNPAIIGLEDGSLVVDLQRPDRETLLFSEFRHLLPLSESGNAKMLVGVDLQRRPRFADLSSDSPHILAAGTTSSGKSEWLRMALSSLLATNTPDTLRLMLIDPKRVTFGELKGSPYLLDATEHTAGALLFTPEAALGGLQRLIEIMEERYELFAGFGVIDLEALRKVSPQKLPRIVCLCDEYGNLAAQKKIRDAIELSINQLGAKARAAGIHLILATQDPRAQILSPLLKSNLGTRVCLRTTSSTQSRMMLEQNGAEALLGRGDLFFKTTGEPVRLQAPLLEDTVRQELYTQLGSASRGKAGQSQI